MSGERMLKTGMFDSETYVHYVADVHGDREHPRGGEAVVTFVPPCDGFLQSVNAYGDAKLRKLQLGCFFLMHDCGWQERGLMTAGGRDANFAFTGQAIVAYLDGGSGQVEFSFRKGRPLLR